ncbi:MULTISPECIES: NADP-dependent glyceraldehyde-3-phosphate dehydrogenase [Clostridium]|jgi:glyceraldehyde-3-phosphate dehydrogenase (NADP+)|uniref:Glyceraldehyde-3-phosphate dehydrogenase (NADP+) n=1 Tax=Clostridium intestinale DSM 6191 TaxID=1121320 RepID=A0A1M6EVH5_9CLOT|nr:MULTISPECIES: NADP-dependent glyceraldehyde-3-phosphate dehydrogenase [Clostridium]SHI89477.1 glyceraldehyde-3-phosphate dehydrogenase (NADP+) [Clostridium intestinale DSM 6191]
MFNDLCCKDKIYRNYVGGEWVKSETSKLISINSPVDGSLVGKVQAMSKEEVDYAIQNAKEAQKEWDKMPINKRATILLKAADLLDEKAEEIANIMVLEIAKDKKSAISEVNRTADYIRFSADTAKNMAGETLPGESFPGTGKGKISIVNRVALGVVLAISPFNYPVNLSASKIAPALMAGNSIVLKPATQGSISALHLVRVFQEAGVPAGVINTITGRGSEIGDYVVGHPLVDFINFTGSTEIGLRISGITTMKPLLMELGGKDAAIVLEDADLDLAAHNIVAGAYSYSGQRCTAVKRILVIDKVADELVKKVREKVKTLKVGNPINEQVDVVPLIDDKAADYVESLILESKEKGATILEGGNREGNLIYPTLVDNVTLDMRLAWEEPFGPVLPIIRVNNVDEAISIANKSEYGLQSSVFTKDINKAFYVANKLEVGTVQINNKTERGPDHFPFSGVKASGIGTQGIRYSIEAMSRPKAVVLNIE